MNTFNGRKYAVMILIILVGMIFVIRLFSLQVLDPTYRISAESNSRRLEIRFPARGLIYERNGDLLVYNEAAYDLLVNPSMLGEFDTLDLTGILNISKERLIAGIEAAVAYSRYKPYVILRQISSENYAVLQEKLYKFTGFFVQSRSLRTYPRPIAAHVLGYVGEVNEEMIARDDYYKAGDYIGISGIERAYEKELRGEKGRKIYLVDVHNRIQGSYQEGRYDIQETVGKNITITIDGDLQAYAEMLMQKFRGSVVALEPSSGEILALVTSPAYEPSLLIGRSRTENYQRLNTDSLKPLFNRALMAQYPPGSTWKPVTGLIGLQEGVISPNTEYDCKGGFHWGSVTVGCHYHVSPLSLVSATQHSCNGYFNEVFRRIISDNKFESSQEAFENWREHVLSFGFGQTFESDLSYELPGLVPEKDLYNNIYGEGHWNFLTIRSLSIGQGELGVTPIQMANLAAIIANRGHYYTPHLLREIANDPASSERYTQKHYTLVDSIHYKWIVDGMDGAVNGGTAGTAWRARLKDIKVCGKTGTAENPPNEDHSIFIAFAPKEDPQIAISVFVENGGFGNYWAAPIAGLMIDKYITDSISRPDLEQYVLRAVRPDLLQAIRDTVRPDLQQSVQDTIPSVPQQAIQDTVRQEQ